MNHVPLSEAARRLRELGLPILTRHLSDAFWSGWIPEAFALRVGNRRMLAVERLPQVADILRAHRRSLRRQTEVTANG
jgi:hypothetical protein